MEFNTGLFSYVKMKGHEEMKVWKGKTPCQRNRLLPEAQAEKTVGTSGKPKMLGAPGC